MDFQIALILGQDGITNGAIYALLALALVLVFAVTRVIFIPQGEFVAYGALTLAMIENGIFPATLWLLIGAGLVVTAIDGIQALRSGQAKRLVGIGAINIAYPFLMLALVWSMPLKDLPLIVQVLLTLLVVVPMGPMMYRIVYQPIAEAPVLVLLIISVAAHVAMVGLGLVFFGAEGYRTPPFSLARFEVGPMFITGQAIWVVLSSLVLIVALALFFGRTIYGKALRATAINRNGARLMGISPSLAGKLTFFLAALIGVLSGVLISPITTIYYDTGFLIGLKGFVGAIIGGLASYPIAAAGAIMVGLLEAFSSFWASAYKEVIVFSLVIPVLIWRSLTTHHMEEEE
jgi:branched-chain amino acid transport system permease protein